MIGRQAGFTLIEVLVALAIVAITLGAGIKAAGALADNTERLTDASLGQWCADNQLIGLKLQRPTLSTGDSLSMSYPFGSMQINVNGHPVQLIRASGW